MTLKEAVLSIFSKRQADKHASLEDLKRRRIAGEELDPQSVAAILDAAAMTWDDFERAVENQKEVGKSWALINMEVDTQTELGFLGSETERLKRELEASIIALKTKHSADMAGIQQRTSELSQRLLQISNARVFIMEQPKPIDVATRLQELKNLEAAERQKIEGAMLEMEGYRRSADLTPERYKKWTGVIAAAEARRKEIADQYSSIEWGSL